MPRPASPLVAGLLLAFALASAVFFWMGRVPATDMELAIDATLTSDACCALRVKVTGATPALTELRPAAGVRTLHRLPLRGSVIRSLVIQWDSASTSSLVIHGITVSRDGRVLHSLSALSIDGFLRLGVQPGQLVADGVLFTSDSSSAPEVYQSISLPASSSALTRGWWSLSQKRLDSFVGLTLLGVVACVIARVRRWPQFTLALSVLAMAAFLHFLPRLVAGRSFRDDASEALGSSAYFGFWKGNERVLHWAALLGVALVCAVITLASRLRRLTLGLSKEAGEEEEGTVGQRLSRRWWIGPAVLAGIVTLYLLPDLQQGVRTQPHYVYAPNWDLGNLLYWDYLVSRGAVPIRDFWYPYGLQYLYSLSLPFGLLIRLLSDAMAWLYLFAGVYATLARLAPAKKVMGRFLAVGAVLVAGVAAQGVGRLSCGDQGVMWLCSRPERYLLALGIVLLYAGAGGQARSVRLLLGASVLHATLAEPAQLLYAAPAVAVLLLIEVVSTQPLRLAPIRRRLATDAATFALPVVVGAGVLALNGQLRGTLSFYRSLGGLSAYAATPTSLASWLARPRQLDGFVYWCFPLAVVLGLGGVLATRARSRTAHATVLALGVLGFMILQKQVTRPGNESNIWLPLLMGPLLWMVIHEDYAHRRYQAVTGAAAGVVAAFVLVSGGLSPLLARIGSSPRRLLTGAVTLATGGPDFDALERERFDPTRLQNFDYQGVVREVESRTNGAQPRVWVFGDEPALNILLHQERPYYYVTSYDVSPLESQRRLISQLERDPPALAVFRRSVAPIDGIPYEVRDPVLYSWAVQHFAPLAIVGDFEVLKPRAAGEPVALGWWRNKLGPTIDVGHVMEISHLPDRRCASPPTPSCTKFVVVSFESATPLPPQAELGVTVDGSPFTVRFSTSSGARRYVLNLDRLWFWSAGGRGVPRSVDLPTAGGGRVELVDREADDSVLY